jgi:hypothetical protein
MAAAANGTSSAVDATVAKLLNFAEPLDVALLDATVTAFYGAGSNEEVISSSEQLEQLYFFKSARANSFIKLLLITFCLCREYRLRPC